MSIRNQFFPAKNPSAVCVNPHPVNFINFMKLIFTFMFLLVIIIVYQHNGILMKTIRNRLGFFWLTGMLHYHTKRLTVLRIKL